MAEAQERYRGLKDCIPAPVKRFYEKGKKQILRKLEKRKIRNRQRKNNANKSLAKYEDDTSEKDGDIPFGTSDEASDADNESQNKGNIDGLLKPYEQTIVTQTHKSEFSYKFVETNTLFNGGSGKESANKFELGGVKINQFRFLEHNIENVESKISLSNKGLKEVKDDFESIVEHIQIKELQMKELEENLHILTTKQLSTLFNGESGKETIGLELELCGVKIGTCRVLKDLGNGNTLSTMLHYYVEIKEIEMKNEIKEHIEKLYLVKKLAADISLTSIDSKYVRSKLHNGKTTEYKKLIYCLPHIENQVYLKEITLRCNRVLVGQALLNYMTGSSVKYALPNSMILQESSSIQMLEQGLQLQKRNADRMYGYVDIVKQTAGTLCAYLLTVALVINIAMLVHNKVCSVENDSEQKQQVLRLNVIRREAFEEALRDMYRNWPIRYIYVYPFNCRMLIGIPVYQDGRLDRIDRKDRQGYD